MDNRKSKSRNISDQRVIQPSDSDSDKSQANEAMDLSDCVEVVRIMNIDTGVKSKAVKLPKQSGIYTLCWDPTGNSLAFAGDSRDIQIIKVKQVKSKEKNTLLKELLAEDTK